MDAHLTVQETAESLGVSTKTIQRRIERGTIESFRRDGRRLIPVVEVERLRQAENLGPAGVFPAVPGGTQSGDFSAVLARLEELAAENGRFRALQEVNESTRQQLEEELHQVRAQVRELEAKLVDVDVVERATALVAETPRRRFFRR